MLVLLLPALLSGASGGSAEILRKQLKEPVGAGESVALVNMYGDIRIRGNDAKTLDTYAVIQNLEEGTPAPEMKTEHKDGQVVVTVEYTEKPKDRPDRADLVFYVPAGTTVHVQTADGLIEVKGFKGDVTAETKSGNVVIRSVKGTVNAQSEDGPLQVDLEAGVTNRPQEFITRTGDISLYFWEGVNADATLETSGEISTDFTLQVDFDGAKEPDKKASARIGAGGAAIHAASKRGRIRLLRLVKTLPKAE